MGLYQEKCGFTKKRNKSVKAMKEMKRLMVRAKVKALKKAKKSVDLQKINQEVLEAVKRKKQQHRPKHLL